MPTRVPAVGDGFSEIYINQREASLAHGVRESLAASHSLLMYDAVASASECSRLCLLAEAAASVVREKMRANVGRVPVGMPRMVKGRYRMPVMDSFDEAGQALCDELLTRVLAMVQVHLPALADELFGGSLLEPSCIANESLTFTPGEPAVNLYRQGGVFNRHEDGQSLTVLVPLTDGSAFEGGGTAFFSTEGPDADGERTVPSEVASFVLTPPKGAALLWCGDVSHAGQLVTSGQRVVFVASLSPTTGASGCEDVLTKPRREWSLEQRTAMERLRELAILRSRRERGAGGREHDVEAISD